jgi:hypothetical protein
MVNADLVDADVKQVGETSVLLANGTEQIVPLCKVELQGPSGQSPIVITVGVMRNLPVDVLAGHDAFTILREPRNPGCKMGIKPVAMGIKPVAMGIKPIALVTTRAKAAQDKKPEVKSQKTETVEGVTPHGIPIVTNGVHHVDPTVAGNPSHRDVRPIQDRANGAGAVQTDIGNEPIDMSPGGLNDIDPTVLDGQLDTDPIQSGTEPTSIGSSELIR